MHQVVSNTKTIIEKLKEGDKETYRLLFDLYYRALCLYASQLTGNGSSSEDLVQNVFLKLWEKRERLCINSSIKSYLYKSVYNGFVNKLSKKKKEDSLLDTVHYDALQELIREEEAILQEKLTRVNREIAMLPPKSREIFIMNKKRGLTCKEIAHLLDLSENTVESHISRALKRIRSKFLDSTPLNNHSVA